MIDAETAVQTDPSKTVPPDAPQGCPGTESDAAGKSSSCYGCPNQAACASGEAKNAVDPDMQLIEQRIGANIKHKFLILSGKGGVGKSTFAAQLTYALAARTVKKADGIEEPQFDVGLLDIDICGPSAPKMMNVEGYEVKQSNIGWQPVYVEDNLGVMSIGFMLPGKDDAVIWRGARKTGLIKQFLKDVDWGLLDFLIVDSPPGTSDEHISLVQFLKTSKVDGAIIVTTPQEVSLLDVRKEINFCKKSGTPVLGVVENMAGFVCPSCAHCTEIFAPSSGGAIKMCQEMEVPYLGRIPLDPALAQAAEMGKAAFLENPDSPGVKAFGAVVDTVLKMVL